MNSDAQRSYNWAYGLINGGHPMFRYISQGRHLKGNPARQATAMGNYARRLSEAAVELRTLAEYLPSAILAQGSIEVELAAAELAKAETAVTWAEIRAAVSKSHRI